MKKRFLAAVIDGFLFVVFLIIYTFSATSINGMITHNFIAIFIYYFVIDFIFFTSPGKWLYNLKITTIDYQEPERYLIVFRSLIKIFIIFTVIGILFMCIALLDNREPLYDTTLGLTVSNSKK